jgi:hypothetical protein
MSLGANGLLIPQASGFDKHREGPPRVIDRPGRHAADEDVVALAVNGYPSYPQPGNGPAAH